MDEAKHIPELLPPAVYFPYNKMGQSAAGFACDLTGGIRPFKEAALRGRSDAQHGDARVPEKRERKLARARVFRSSGFASGSLGLEFASDGSLFVFGTDRGWGARGGKPFALQRLAWTGRTPFEIHELRARPDGFEFTFTEPVDAASAGAAASYAVETYTYIYQSSYGSPEVDKTTPTIKNVAVAPGGRSVRVVLDALAIGHVHEFHLPGVRSAKGTPLLHDAAYYTLFQIPQS